MLYLYFTNSKHNQQDGNVDRKTQKYQTEVKQSKQNETVSEINGQSKLRPKISNYIIVQLESSSLVLCENCPKLI